jgi:hypothetical protein
MKHLPIITLLIALFATFTFSAESGKQADKEASTESSEETEATAAKPKRLPTNNWYNGYSPEERGKKFEILKNLIKEGTVPAAKGPCMICNDPESPVEYHSEDYGEPFLWEPPAMYSLCQSCHRFKLHGRFRYPSSWEAYVAHVRRGGYARDLKDPKINEEVKAAAIAIRNKQPFELSEIRPYPKEAGKEWFATLRMDDASKTDPAARPRGK